MTATAPSGVTLATTSLSARSLLPAVAAVVTMTLMPNSAAAAAYAAAW
jgi:hypothetical protein